MAREGALAVDQHARGEIGGSTRSGRGHILAGTVRRELVETMGAAEMFDGHVRNVEEALAR